MPVNRPCYVLVPGAERPEVMEPLSSSLQQRGAAAKVFSLSGYSGEPENLRGAAPGLWKQTLVREICESCGVGRTIVLVGHSLGGMLVSDVALALASRNPVERVFAICPAFELRHWAARLHSMSVRARIPLLGKFPVTRSIVRLLYPSGRIPVHRWFLQSRSKGEHEGVQKLLDSYVYPWWPTVSVGVYLHDRERSRASAIELGRRLHLIDSDLDNICAPTPKRIRWTSGSYRVLNGGHFLPLEKPDELAAIIQQAL